MQEQTRHRVKLTEENTVTIFIELDSFVCSQSIHNFLVYYLTFPGRGCHWRYIIRSTHLKVNWSHDCDLKFVFFRIFFHLVVRTTTAAKSTMLQDSHSSYVDPFVFCLLDLLFYGVLVPFDADSRFTLMLPYLKNSIPRAFRTDETMLSEANIYI